MQATCDLAALRQAVVLLEGEVMLDGWAAERGRRGRQVPGLVMVTSWRVIFVDGEDGVTAFPILKIDYVESASSSQVTMSVWYDRMQLTFDSAAIARGVVNLLRQDPCWRAAEITVADQALDCGGPQVSAIANDDQGVGDLATVA